MTIVIIGYYGFANAGDEAILAAMLRELRALHSGLRIIVSSGDPGGTASSHSVESIAWKNVAALHRAIESCDLVLIGGGGLFQDYWGADPNTLLTERHWGIAYYAGCAYLAALVRRPLMLYAVGVGPLTSEPGIRLTRAACDAASQITVRDEGSRDALQRIGVDLSKIIVTADPAFTFQPASSLSLAEAAGVPLEHPILGVAVRAWSIGVDPAFLEHELARALDFFLDRTQGSVVFLPFQQIEGEHEDDRAMAARVRGKMRFAERAVVARGAVTPSQIYTALGECDLVLGMRLHALIFATLSGKPSVALSYDPKVDALTSLTGREETAMPVQAIDSEALAGRLIAALHGPKDSPEYLARLQGLSRANAMLALGLTESPAPEIQFTSELRELSRRAIRAQFASLESAATQAQALQARIDAFDHENATLRSTIAALNQHASDLNEALAQANTESAALQERLHASHAASESARAAALMEIDRFRDRMAAELATYRNQRAWQIMLLVRKAYSLLFRGSKRAFFRWAAATALGKPGSLAEYDLPFPDIATYIPDTFRANLLPGSGRAPLALPAAEGPARREPAQRDRYDVIILAIIDFDFRFQRPQQIAAALARNGHRVFWISPSRFLPSATPEPYKLVSLRENIFEVHLRAPAPDVYNGELREEHLGPMREAMNALYADWSIAESTTLLQLPFWRKLALQIRHDQGSKLVYDCMDDWDTFENMGAFNVTEEKSLINECDVLVVTGAELVNKFRAQSLHPILIRNGADFDFFAQAGPSTLLADVPRPIVGYFGAIADWIDLDLVEKVAALRPTYSFVLIGQVFGRDMSRLEAMPNVFLLGSKQYQDIPAYLYHFDACTIPFLLNQVTKATDPVKLYEYFSLGKPVVATDMAELQQCGDLIYIGGEAEDFAAKLDTALHEDEDSLVRRRIDFARTHTWAARVHDFDQAVRASYARVSILIVTYNSQEFVTPCIESILRNTAYPNYEVIILDNASSDDTVPLIEACVKRYPVLRFIPLSENSGFAGGNNLAAREASGEYLIFLNIDTMVTPGWIHHLLRHIETDASIGLICPVTNFAGNEVKINVNYGNSSEMDQFAAALARNKRGQTIDIDVAPLFCALIPRAVWRQVGELDDSFGIGMFEDDDFAMRVRTAGYRIAAAEDCFIHHFGQGSFSKIPSDAYNQLFEKNRKRYEEKWSSAWKPHRTRAGVRPPFEEQRFIPADFVR